MTLAFTELGYTMDATPAAGSQASASMTPTTGRGYFVAVTQIRTGASADPVLPTLAGWGQTWEQVSDNIWGSTGTNRRRTTVFYCFASAPTAGGVTATYATTPTSIAIRTVEVTGCTANGWVQVATFGGNIAANTLFETTALSAAGSVDNRILSFCDTNQSSGTTLRPELDSDTNGDADWTQLATHAYDSAPTQRHMTSYLNGDPALDLTAGWIATASGVGGVVAIEVENSSAPPPAVGSGYWGYLKAEGGGDPPPPPETEFLVGAAIQQQGSETDAQATARFEAQTGGPVEFGRRYISGSPVNAWSSYAQCAQDTNTRHRCVSFKGTPTQATIVNFINTIPNDGYRTYLAWNHEPENDGGSMTPTFFKAGCATLLAAVNQVGRLDIIPTFILMGWTDIGNVGGGTPDWYPASLSQWAFGLDTYDSNSNRDMEFLSQESVSQFRAQGGWRFFIAETGTKRTGSDGVNWIHESCDYLRSIESDGIQWFDSSVGANGPWYLPAGVMSAAWGQEANA